MDLTDTIKRCQSGEKHAFEILFKSIEKKALATAYLISGTRCIAEDILQETYIKCFTEINSLRNPETFNTWFYRILVRTGWLMTKRYGKAIPTEINTDDSSTFDSFEESATKDAIVQAISHLSTNLKVVVILFYFNDMPIEQIAKVLGCFTATVKSRLFYARKLLAKELISDFKDYFGIQNGGGING